MAALMITYLVAKVILRVKVELKEMLSLIVQYKQMDSLMFLSVLLLLVLISWHLRLLLQRLIGRMTIISALNGWKKESYLKIFIIQVMVLSALKMN